MTATPIAAVSERALPDFHRDVLRRLLDAAESELEPDQLAAETHLRDDLGMTSLESLSLVLELEDHLGIDFEDDELAALATVGDLLATIDRKRDAMEASPADG